MVNIHNKRVVNNLHKTKRPSITVRPSLVNALLPLFIKNLFWMGLLCFGISFILISINSIFFDVVFVPSLQLTFLVTFLLTFLSISIKIIILRCTKYIFYETNAVKEFRLIIIRKRSVVYSRITNITLKMSVWDRITRAGTIILHTGEDEYPDILMAFIKNPQKIEELIYRLIHQKNSGVSHETLNK